MDTTCQIHLDSLKINGKYKLKKTVLPEQLNIGQEKELIFTKSIEIEGEAYIADNDLILILNIKFYVSIPCSICNEFTEKSFSIKNLHSTEKLTNINSIYDFKEEIKNACFLEIPSFIKCSENCPEINNIKKYLNVTKENFPFSNL